LEDIQEGSGELIVYPGSHRFERVMMNDVDSGKITDNWQYFSDTVGKKWKEFIEGSGIKPIVYRPVKGEILIWHENLMHGGSVRKNAELSRKSIVSHNFARGSIAYYDSTGSIGFMDCKSGS
jgi:ectoine hydroxylase-related dioxygenase (phytanoyl-CoA dioxygenase family)